MEEVNESLALIRDTELLLDKVPHSGKGPRRWIGSQHPVHAVPLSMRQAWCARSSFLATTDRKSASSIDRFCRCRVVNLVAPTRSLNQQHQARDAELSGVEGARSDDCVTPQPPRSERGE
jgi:hypothetical protein